ASLGGKAWSWLTGILGGGGGGVDQWRNVVLQVMQMLGLGSSPGAFSTIMSQMRTESGGNAAAVNKTDINWQLGHPSVGLMQVIKGTFDAFAGPFRNLGPFLYGVSTNALANIYAGVNYALHTYGANWQNVLGHGHGYGRGGTIREHILGVGASRPASQF